MQIGPHFLYNTLNSIKWMAVLNNQPGIKQMVESLMKLLGAVAYNKEDEISLREELELLESYIFIQKVRFMNFRVEYDVPEQVLSMKIGRFMLQPFVENCIIHGLHGLDYEGVIRIRIPADDHTADRYLGQWSRHEGRRTHGAQKRGGQRQRRYPERGRAYPAALRRTVRRSRGK